MEFLLFEAKAACQRSKNDDGCTDNAPFPFPHDDDEEDDEGEDDDARTTPAARVIGHFALRGVLGLRRQTMT